MAQMAYTRKWLVDTLRRIGRTQAADDALREMPEKFDVKHLEESGKRHDISRDVLADAFGVSP